MIAALKYVILFSLLLCISVFYKGYFRFDTRNTLPLRGILCVLVVLTHVSSAFAEKGIISWDMVGRWLNYGQPVVAMFFFLSGYGLEVSFKNKGYDYLKSFWPKRLRSLLPALLCISLLYVLIKYFYLHWSWNHIFDPLHGTFPIEASWYVYVLLILYGAFYVIYRMLSSGVMRIFSIWIIVLLYCLFMSQYLRWSIHWWITVPAFAVGITFAYFESQFKEFLEQKKWLSVLLLIGLLILTFAFRFIHLFDPIGGSFIYWCLPLVVVAIVYRMGMFQWGLLRFLGRWSYEIFLIHQIFILLW